MTLQRSQGRLRPVVAPLDELPNGEAATKPAGEAMGRPPYAQGSPEARQAASRGGKARRGWTQLADTLGLAGPSADPTFEPYRREALNFANQHKAHLRRNVGAGELSPAVRSFVMSSALQIAASRWAFDSGQPELGSRLADSSRQNLLAAHELAARDAEARRKAPSTLAALLRGPGRASASHGRRLDDATETSRARQLGGKDDDNAGGPKGTDTP